MTPMDPILPVLEAAYRFDLDDEGWLLGLTEALQPLLDIGYGIHAFLVDARLPNATVISTPVSTGLTPEWNATWRANWWESFMVPTPSWTMHAMLTHSAFNHSISLWNDLMTRDPEFAARIRQHTPPVTTSAPAPAPAGTMRYPDSLNVVALDATGIGCAFAANRATPLEAPVVRSVSERLAQLATHIAAAYRLRRRGLTALDPDHAAAILDPDLRVLHATGNAAQHSALAAIRHAAIAVRDARDHEALHLSPAQAVDAWRALTAGQWSVLDHFDKDGRRYWIARPNAPLTATAALTEREAQVVSSLALGHSNKLIAYELGLHPSTVSQHIASAARKLGVSTRPELLRVVRARRAEGSGL